jgi:hypothetical protein
MWLCIILALASLHFLCFSAFEVSVLHFEFYNMDASAVNANVTVDDFDSVISYADQAAWETPDPSSSSFNASGSQWLMGTYHSTSVANATLSFNFTGMHIPRCSWNCGLE